MSDFLLPRYFEPGTLAPYSYLQSQGGSGPAAPFNVALGGYAIQRSAGAGETSVQGEVRAERLPKARHWSSRTFRRGVRLSDG